MKLLHGRPHLGPPKNRRTHDVPLPDLVAAGIAQHLGHTDPGFSLRVYTHLMPSSEDSARQAIDQTLGPPSRVTLVSQRGR